MTRFANAGIQMRVSATEDNVATMRQSFSDIEEEETMIHLKPFRASFKTRTVS